MPRFHFTTLDGSHGTEEDSCVLPSVASARQSAIAYAGDVLREVGDDIYRDDLRVIVTDEAGRLCWDLKVSGIEGPGAAGA